MKNADTPAIPLSGDAYVDFAAYSGDDCSSYNPECQGLTKREMFAMHAMQGLLSNGNISSVDIAKHSLVYADKLLKELEK